MLHELGEGKLTDETRKSAETFICMVYNATYTDSVDIVC